jgi:hypothetical protein
MNGFDPARGALFLAEGTRAILQRRLEEAGRTPRRTWSGSWTFF